jgi:hypothetical protein
MPNQSEPVSSAEPLQLRVVPSASGMVVAAKVPAEGRNRIAQANTVHGQETRVAHSNRSMGLARLAELEELGYAIGLLSAPRTRGPKPKGA